MESSARTKSWLCGHMTARPLPVHLPRVPPLSAFFSLRHALPPISCTDRRQTDRQRKNILDEMFQPRTSQTDGPKHPSKEGACVRPAYMISLDLTRRDSTPALLHAPS
jgi:hypothetical protein